MLWFELFISINHIFMKLLNDISFWSFLANCFNSLALLSHFAERGFPAHSREMVSDSEFKKIPRLNKGKQSELIVFSSPMNLGLIAIVYQLPRTQDRSGQSLSRLVLSKPFEKTQSCCLVHLPLTASWDLYSSLHANCPCLTNAEV